MIHPERQVYQSAKSVGKQKKACKDRNNKEARKALRDGILDEESDTKKLEDISYAPGMAG